MGKRGPKPKTWTEREIEGLGMMRATRDEVAAFCKVSTSTVDNWFKDDKFCAAFKKGTDSRLLKLKRAQWKSAIEDENITMQIWLGKNELGQSDKQEIDMTVTPPVIVECPVPRPEKEKKEAS